MALRYSPLPAELIQKLDTIPGWLSPTAIDFTARVFAKLDELNAREPILEFGVFKGRYLSLLYYLGKHRGAQVVGVDGMFVGVKILLEERWIPSAIAEIENAVRLLSGEIDRLEIICADTADITPERLTNRLFSFISIDAGHEATDVLKDFSTAQLLLSDTGVIAADDVFNGMVPGVAEGAARFFLLENGGGDLAPFAYCANKLFLCRRKHHEMYLAWAREQLLDDRAKYLKNSREHNQNNDNLSFYPELFGFKIIPFSG